MKGHETCLFQGEVIYLIAFTLWLLGSCLQITFWVDYPVIRIVCLYFLQSAFVFLLLYFLLKPYSKKDIFGFILLCIAGILADKSVYGKELIYCVIFIWFSKDLDLKRVFTLYLFIQGSVLFITVLGAKSGLILNKEFGNNTDRIQYALGYTFATYSAHILAFLTIIWFLVKKDAGILSVLILFLLNLYVYSQNRGRTDLIVASWGLIGFLLEKLNKRLKCEKYTIQKKLGNIYIYSTLLFILVTWCIRLSYYYYPKYMEGINTLFTGRPDLEIKAIIDYGFSIFGRIIRWVGIGSWEASNYILKYNYVDNSFLKTTLTYGLLYGAFLYSCLFSLLIRFRKRNDIYELIATSCLVLYSLFNAHLLALNIQCVVLLLSYLLKDE